jgi:hypothetical protein
VITTYCALPVSEAEKELVADREQDGVAVSCVLYEHLGIIRMIQRT